MAVYKDNATGTWRVIYRFTNWKGERKQTQKRGFATKREAQAWEHEAMLKQGAKLDMTFGSFFEVYEADKKQRVKESTWESKSHVIRTKILPYFENHKMPPFLCEEMQEYIKMLYDIKPDERLFTVTKSYLNHEMERGAKQAGVKKIRVHDIRHSAVSLLINMGFSVLAIGERMGHEAEKITYRYAHLFPTVQTEMAEKLEMERMTKEEKS